MYIPIISFYTSETTKNPYPMVYFSNNQDSEVENKGFWRKCNETI